MVQELSRGVTGKVVEQIRKKANIDESAFSSIIGYSRWLKTPNVAFDNATPLKLLSSEVWSDLVDGLIAQLELRILPA